MRAISFSWHCNPTLEEIFYRSRSWGYQFASYLTDPVCKLRENIVKYQIVDEVAPHPGIAKRFQSISIQNSDLVRLAEKCYLVASSICFLFLTPMAIPAIGIRSICSQMDSQPFLHYRGKVKEKSLEKNTATFLHWNICGIKGGYEVGEGGQLPIREDLMFGEKTRLDKIIEEILRADADIISLNELFDVQDFIYVAGALEGTYAHMIGNCGSGAIALNAGLALFSKYKVAEVIFCPFPKDMLVGYTKYCNKGVLEAKLIDDFGKIATVFLTHLQHSEEPALPSFDHPKAQDEVTGRKGQIQFLKKRVERVDEGVVVVLGDLNMEEKELERADKSFYDFFVKEEAREKIPTWGGDEWYVGFGNRESYLFGAPERKRKPSPPVNLDYILSKGGKISTNVLQTGYNHKNPPSRESLSDHMRMQATITISR